MALFEYINSSKNTFNNYLVFILTPNIYDGLNTIYNCALKFFNEYNIKKETNKNLLDLEFTDIFNKFLTGLEKLTSEQKQKEYNKIKRTFENTHGPYFDSLIKTCLKLNYNALSFDIDTNTFKDLNVDNINIPQFIFNCYIEAEYYFSKNNELFTKKNKKTEIYDVIKQCIHNTIIKSISTKELYENFLINKQKKPIIPNFNMEQPAMPTFNIPQTSVEQNKPQYLSPISENNNAESDYNDINNNINVNSEKVIDKINDEYEYVKADDFEIKSIKKKINYENTDVEEYFNTL
jgi:hypothetical protein